MILKSFNGLKLSKDELNQPFYDHNYEFKPNYVILEASKFGDENLLYDLVELGLQIERCGPIDIKGNTYLNKDCDSE